MAALHVDEGTAFRAWLQEDLPELSAIDLLLKNAERKSRAWRTGDVAKVFVPALASHVRALVRKSGRAHATLEIGNEARIELIAYGIRPCVKVHLMKEGAWCRGIDAWLQVWLPVATNIVGHLLDAEPIRGEELAAWHVHKLELCSDFTGLIFMVDDLPRFIGHANTYLNETENAPGERVDAHEYFRSSRFRAGASALETVSLNRRSDNGISVSTHNKTLQVTRCHKCAPEESVYADTWRSNGWTGEDLRRVEVRAAGNALRVKDEKTSQLIDLSDVQQLTDPDNLARYWFAVLQRFRLLDSGEQRRDRAQTDPRWVKVHTLCGRLSDSEVGGCQRLAAPKKSPAERLSAKDATATKALAMALARLVAARRIDPAKCSLVDMLGKLAKEAAFRAVFATQYRDATIELDPLHQEVDAALRATKDNGEAQGFLQAGLLDSEALVDALTAHLGKLVDDMLRARWRHAAISHPELEPEARLSLPALAAIGANVHWLRQLKLT